MSDLDETIYAEFQAFLTKAEKDQMPIWVKYEDGRDVSGLARTTDSDHYLIGPTMFLHGTDVPVWAKYRGLVWTPDGVQRATTR